MSVIDIVQPIQTPSTGQRDFAQFKELQGYRYNWDWLWQRVADYVIPHRADFTVTRFPGQRRDYEIYDTTATWALNQLAAGLHQLLTTPSLPWFYLGMNDELSRQQTVQVWLSDTQARINQVFNDPGSRFQSQAHEVYTDLGAFGTAVMDVQDDKGVKFCNRFLGECFIGQSHHGTVDTMYRAFLLPFHRIVDIFGEKKLPSDMIKTGTKDPFHKFKMLHVTKPAESGSKWDSRYYLLDSQTLLREGTFKTFPYITPRWSQSHVEIYGRGPAITALADILMVNELKRVLLRAAHKAVDPPLLQPSSGFMQAINLNPGQTNYFDETGIVKEPYFLESKANFPIGERILEMTQQDIIRAFYVDMLQLPGGLMPGAKNQNTYMTATEAMMRRENAMRVIGPVVSRLQNEFLGPLITKVFEILLKRRSIAPPPQGVHDKPIDVHYVSPLTIAQSGAEVDNWTRFITQIQPIAGLDPTIMDGIDLAAVPRYLAAKYHLPMQLMRTQQQVAQIQQQRAQTQQAQQDNIQANTNLTAAKRNTEYEKSLTEAAGRNQAQ